MNRIRVVIADDHETIRAGLKLLLETQPDLEVVGEAGDGEAAVLATERLRPEVAVLDVSMPKMNGLDATRAIIARAPRTAVVALTRFADVAYVNELVRAGALGYVLKQSPSTELIAAIRDAARGKIHLDPTVAERSASRAAARARGGASVSDRETDVLRRVAQGFSNKEIAAALDLSVKTVEVHKANGMRKLGLEGRTDLVKYAVLEGWLSDV